VSLRYPCNAAEIKGVYDDEKQAKKLLAEVAEDERSGKDSVRQSVRQGCALI
jgi:hypothetical protein